MAIPLIAILIVEAGHHLSPRGGSLLGEWGYEPARAAALPLQEATSGDHGDEILDALGLREAEFLFIDVHALPEEPFTVVVPIDGAAAMIDLQPHAITRPGYRLFAQTAHDETVELEPGPVRTVRGEIFGVPLTQAAGALLDDGLYLLIVLPDGEQRWLQPARSVWPDAPEDLYVLHRDVDLMPHDHLRCGVDERYRVEPRTDPPRDLIPPQDMFGNFRGGAGEETLCIAELGIDADYEYYQSWGASIDKVEGRMLLIINTMNLQYENQTGIRHEVSGAVIRISADQPYTSTNAHTLLEQFRDEWRLNQTLIPRDVAQLFSGKDFNGSTIGLAWIGVVCTTWHYSIVQSLNNFACSTDLSAHELGHNWNAGHCDCPSHTMNPSLTCSNSFHRELTVPTIIAFRESRSCISCAEPGVGALESFTIQKGEHRRGDLVSLLTSDDDSLRIDSEPRGARDLVVLRVNANSPLEEPSVIEITLETGCTSNGVTTVVHMYNYQAQKWKKIGSFPQSRPDSVSVFDITNRPERFIESRSGSMSIRIRMRSSSGAFLARYDLVELNVRP